MITVKHKLLAGITRQYPLKSGCLKLADHKFFKKLTGTSKEKVWTSVPGGKVKACLNELVGRTAFYIGDLDKRLTWISRKLIKEGDTVVDVGANIGIMSLLFSKLTKEKGQVHSFEPNPLLYDDLMSAIKKNKIKNICSIPKALGEKEEKLTLSVPKSNLGLGTLIRTSSEVCQNYDVEVTTLSKYCSLKEISKIDLLKIDVEGFEYRVLIGAKQLFEENPPNFILVELNNFNGRAGEHPVIKLLRNYDYSFLSIPKCLFKFYTHELNLNMTAKQLGNDIIAVQNNLIKEAKLKLATRE